jgi:hypothetical protein
MNKRNQVTIGLIAAIVVLACACPVSGLPSLSGGDTPTTVPFVPSTESVPPTTAPTDAQAPVGGGNVLISDDFSVNSTEMETYTGDGGSTGTENGVYVVRSTADLWQWGRSTSEFDNAVVDVDVTMTVGPSNNNAGFGVVCRLSEREDTSVDGYMLAISGDGYYTIRVISASNMDALVDWTPSDVINQGNASNHIRATCNGNQLALEVNGQEIATANATADGSTSGAIAFAAISFETDSPTAEVQFDNMVVTQP